MEFINDGDTAGFEAYSDKNDPYARHYWMKWDGCFHIFGPGADGESDYLHVDNLEAFIKELQDILEYAKGRGVEV